MKPGRLSVAILAAICGLGASPQAGVAATPSPARYDEAGINDWIKANLKDEGWVYIAADRQAVALGATSGVAVLQDGSLRAQIRREYYEPQKFGENIVRSILMTWLVDCEGRRFQTLEMALYVDSNLSGGGVRSVSEAPQWSPVRRRSQNEQVVARICEAPTKGALR